MAKDVKQLLSKEAIMKEVERSLPIPGFWKTVKLGALHRLLGLRCDEVDQTLPAHKSFANSNRSLPNTSDM